MKKATTSARLKQIMIERNLKQIDILNLCLPYCKKYNIRLASNDLSQYVSGKVEPGQYKLTILGLALNVNETWLMGYDVPRHRHDNNIIDISDSELVAFISLLDEEDKSELKRYITSMLLSKDKYKNTKKK